MAENGQPAGLLSRRLQSFMALNEAPIIVMIENYRSGLAGKVFASTRESSKLWIEPASNLI